MAGKNGWHDVQLVTVRIGKGKWEACRYNYHGDNDAIYCIGKLPKFYVHEDVCFPFEGKDWYVSGYIAEEDITERNESLHPFGENFMLRPWSLPNSKIDDGEKPYKRIPLEVTVVKGNTQ